MACSEKRWLFYGSILFQNHKIYNKNKTLSFFFLSKNNWSITENNWFLLSCQIYLTNQWKIAIHLSEIQHFLHLKSLAWSIFYERNNRQNSQIVSTSKPFQPQNPPIFTSYYKNMAIYSFQSTKNISYLPSRRSWHWPKMKTTTKTGLTISTTYLLYNNAKISLAWFINEPLLRDLYTCSS